VAPLLGLRQLTLRTGGAELEFSSPPSCMILAGRPSSTLPVPSRRSAAVITEGRWTSRRTYRSLAQSMICDGRYQVVPFHQYPPMRDSSGFSPNHSL
jgi:hypothetical protein